MYISVINTNEHPIEVIERIFNGVESNNDGESFLYEDEEWCYHPISIKEFPVDGITVYEVYKAIE